jgi:chromosome partitioning protein
LVVVLFSRKGGTGKTTLVCCLAVALSKRGLNVCVVDSDPQGSCGKWLKLRSRNNEDDITMVSYYDDIGKRLVKLKKDFDVVLVDTPGQDSVEVRSSLLVCDRAIHVTRAAALDNGTIQYVSEFAARAKKRNKKLKIKSVVNSVGDLHKKWVLDTKKQLTLGRMPATKSPVKERAVYLDAMREGYGVHDYPSKNDSVKKEVSSAKRELNAIIKETING